MIRIILYASHATSDHFRGVTNMVELGQRREE